jgi:TonB family protein
MMARFAAVLAAALSVAPGLAAEPVPDAEAPLRQPPILSSAEVAAELARFNDYLIERHASIPPDGFPTVREHAYLLIDSVLKGQRAEGRSKFSDFEKQSLATLFNWSTEFGVYGAGLVARRFAGDGKTPLNDPLLPAVPLELRLEFPALVLSSRVSSWSVQLPYYFMLWNVQHTTTKNGLVTDVVTASTSFAREERPLPPSQATLMLLYSPEEQCAPFQAFWLEQLAIPATGLAGEGPLPGSEVYTTFDKETRIRKEMTFSSRGHGCVAFVLLGFPGTFETNRVSYLDFIKSFSDLSPTAPAPGAAPGAWPFCPPGQHRYENNCVTDPLPVFKVQPEYPRKARKKGIEGQVELRAVINIDGTVGDVTVQQCTHPGVGFEEAAIAAVKQWRYTTTMVNNWPRRMAITIKIGFALARATPQAGKEPAAVADPPGSPP